MASVEVVLILATLGLEENSSQRIARVTSNGRWPKTIKSWLSQQPLLISSSNFKLMLKWPNQNENNTKNEDDLQRKTTSKYLELNTSATTEWSPLRGLNQNTKIKTTSNVLQHQNIKSWISLQLLIGSESNLRLKIRGPNQNWKLLAMKTTSNGRRLQNNKSWSQSLILLDLIQTVTFIWGIQRKS